jgi:hypothetical protein
LGTDLPNRILSAAKARLPDIITSGVASAPPTTPRREILRIEFSQMAPRRMPDFLECSRQAAKLKRPTPD